MPANNATIVDNKKIVEGPATFYDKFDFYAVHMQEILSEIGKDGKITKKDAKTVIPNHVVRPILSTELMAGMTIPAMLSGKERPQGEEITKE